MSRKVIICIPSKGRPEVVQKFLDTHNTNNFQFMVCCEKQELDSYMGALKEHPTVVIITVPENAGVGASRAELFKTAYNANYKYCIMIDDNTYIDDINSVNRVCQMMDDNSQIIGISGINKFGLVINGWNKLPANTLVESKGMFVLLCIRTSIYKDGINYDPTLPIGEDVSFFLDITETYGQGHIFTLVDWNFEKKSFQAGGCTSYNGMTRAYVDEFISLPRLKEKHGDEFFTRRAFGKKKKMSNVMFWKKFFKSLEGRIFKEVPNEE